MADSREMRAGMIEAEIDRFIVEGQYSLAVILSQTMLELLVEREVRGLARGLDTGSFGEATLELLGSFNLNRRTQRFFEHSLDVRFNEVMPDELHAFLDHNRLRNRIVHEGANAGHDEAVASLAAVRGITGRLREIVAERTARVAQAGE
ncbi:MAG TPA: hypothetical protein VJ204_02435 [Solirubrobacterales bacterium]|nr:hypothetical protein [Solirubrobacterales bacterium]